MCAVLRRARWHVHGASACTPTQPCSHILGRVARRKRRSPSTARRLISLRRWTHAVTPERCASISDPFWSLRLLRVCPQSLAYAQAAAAVRTCAYKLKPPVVAGQLPYMAAVRPAWCQALNECVRCFRPVKCARVGLHVGVLSPCGPPNPPTIWVGADPDNSDAIMQSIAEEVTAILATGTCTKLECFR